MDGPSHKADKVELSDQQDPEVRQRRTECYCACHKDPNVKHIIACCDRPPALNFDPLQYF